MLELEVQSPRPKEDAGPERFDDGHLKEQTGKDVRLPGDSGEEYSKEF